MKRKRGRTARPVSPVTAERLAGIESSLRQIQSFMDQYQHKIGSIDRLIKDIDEIKENTRRRRFTLFSRRKRTKDTAVAKQPGGIGPITDMLKDPVIQSLLSKKGSKPGFDMVQIVELLQSPLVQSLFNQRGKEAGKGKRRKSGRSGGSDFSQILKLMQDPTVLHLLGSLK